MRARPVAPPAAQRPTDARAGGSRFVDPNPITLIGFRFGHAHNLARTRLIVDGHLAHHPPGLHRWRDDLSRVARRTTAESSVGAEGVPQRRLRGDPVVPAGGDPPR